jgi:hypothetical protein
MGTVALYTCHSGSGLPFHIIQHPALPDAESFLWRDWHFPSSASHFPPSYQHLGPCFFHIVLYRRCQLVGENSESGTTSCCAVAFSLQQDTHLFFVLHPGFQCCMLFSLVWRERLASVARSFAIQPIQSPYFPGHSR